MGRRRSPLFPRFRGSGGARWLWSLCLLLLFGACQPDAYRLSSHHQSANQNERIAFLILHYTDEDDARSLRLLSESEHKVSAHYLIPRDTDERPLPVYQLVPDDQRAWHAGRSRWHQYAGLNASSLGIEIVNLGYDEKEAALLAHLRRWQPYTEAQIAALGALARELVERYDIPHTQVLGHSDVAPERKQDPGPRFPWRELALRYGVGAWPDEARVAALRQQALPAWPPLIWQQQLARYGYGIAPSGEWDAQSRAVMRAFQLHFRPAQVSGEPDAECQAILMALLERYFPEQ
ncbi:N-acetylmuramoyl-L-alanine amidase [Aeromonas taiwanensis]|uniref:N-acetylmuramoyl-L-alanine amidase n=1 Tax=Aeromonas taiwanensis TaxID=633417 RepID=A0A5F0KFB5_9GAMM|nr:N-acetylmuramoyl-L-alanine amidase [Aeromonas taiwanensis]TFF80392.1 N-acetylmuramoyl-L-alanine amidase [Aeromonas taiwanensis]TFF81425.1 N-acetylmuramoyl-L-alanine amidase [Aeromonas taiwanensis]TFF83243.1 N-acetylmuramoyl-L-alanine amidase [Aeromonas taiwanensis]